MVIHLSGLPGANERAARLLFDLAPGGVYLADRVTPNAGALLPHLFTLTGCKQPAVCFLWHFPAGHPDWPLASTLPYGAPTFLDIAAATIQLTHRRCHCATGGAGQLQHNA